MKKTHRAIISFVSLIIGIMLISAIQVNAEGITALKVNTDAATQIAVGKVLENMQDSQEWIKAYAWAANPASAVFSSLSSDIQTAITFATGNPVNILASMAANEIKNDIMSTVYSQLTPGQRRAVVGTQEYMNYASAIFEIDPDSDEGKNLAESFEYNKDEGLYIYKQPVKDETGKTTYKEWMKISDSCNREYYEDYYGTGRNIFKITASEDKGKISVEEQADLTVAKDSRIEMEGRDVVYAKFKTTDASKLKFGRMVEEITLAKDTDVEYDGKKGTVVIAGESFMLGEKVIDNYYELGKLTVSESEGGTMIAGDGFEIDNMLVMGGFAKKGELTVMGDHYIKGDGTTFSTEDISIGGDRIKVYLDGNAHDGDYYSISGNKIMAKSRDVKTSIDFLNADERRSITIDKYSKMDINKNGIRRFSLNGKGKVHAYFAASDEDLPLDINIEDLAKQQKEYEIKTAGRGSIQGSKCYYKESTSLIGNIIGYASKEEECLPRAKMLVDMKDRLKEEDGDLWLLPLGAKTWVKVEKIGNLYVTEPHYIEDAGTLMKDYLVREYYDMNGISASFETLKISDKNQQWNKVDYAKAEPAKEPAKAAEVLTERETAANNAFGDGDIVKVNFKKTIVVVDMGAENTLSTELFGIIGRGVFSSEEEKVMLKALREEDKKLTKEEIKILLSDKVFEWIKKDLRNKIEVEGTGGKVTIK